MSDARRSAEEALAKFDQHVFVGGPDHPDKLYHDRATAVAGHLRALLAESAGLRDAIEIEREGQRSMARALAEINRLSRLDVAVNLAEPAPAPDAAASFGTRLLAEWWENDCSDLDGASVQEIAEETGLWHQVERHADGVECEWCGNEGPCGELTEAGLAALGERVASSRAGIPAPDAVRDAAERLVRKIDEVDNSPEYMAVWGLFWTHGYEYKGPKYEAELNALKAALWPEMAPLLAALDARPGGERGGE